MFRYWLLCAWVVFSFGMVDSPVFAQAKSGSSKSAPPMNKKANPRSSTKSPMNLARLATEQNVFFLASNGWKKPDPKSTNHTEQLWAEQSVQDFISQLSDEITKVVENQVQGNETGTLLASTGPIFLRALIEHPMAISLTSFTAGKVPEINLSIVVNTEADEPKIRESFEKLIQAAPKEGPNGLVETTIEGAKFYRPNVPGEESSLAPQFGMYKSYLIVTMGQNMTVKTIKKITGTDHPPAWLDTLHEELKIGRPTLIWQINVDAIWKSVDSLIVDPKVRGALEASGLFAIKRLATVSGLDAVGTVNKMRIETVGTPSGLFTALPDKPLTTADLKYIPANPTQATIVRFDLATLFQQSLKIADQVDPSVGQQFENVSEQVETAMGFSITKDLLESFGDVWSMYVSGNEAMGFYVPGVVVTATVKDQAKLAKVQETIVGVVKQYLQQMGPQVPVTLTDFTARGTKGYRVQFNNVPIPISPSWIVTKEQFVLGLSPQLVTSHLATAKAKTSLADHEAIKTAFERDPNATMLSFRDPKPEIQGLYTIVNMMSPMLSGQLQQQGIEFTLPPLPPFADIEPHLLHSVSTFSRQADGWKSESHGVVPSFSALSMTSAPVLVALLLPAVQQARENARRTQSKNNLKQIALAMHNYESVYLHFPSRVLGDKKGNPGLSWRVAILPFIDETLLYNEFHLDEPWDSEHNKALISRMPMTYASPNDPDLVAEGKTRYVVPVGKGFMFDCEKGPKIADITDGTSNTIAIVEARPDHAVTWTQPDDLEIDLNDLLAGLRSSRVGGFHVLIADGSVRFVSDNIDLDTLLSLFTKAGGEVIRGF